MTAIPGIDAAWTMSHPSGAAVVVGNAGVWRLVAVASSYAELYRQAGFEPATDNFSARLLLDSAKRLAEERIGLIAADIPLAHSPIVRRRESDNAVSLIYGARHASTHTPSATRPDALADSMRADFLAEGYALQTVAPVTGGLIEVYPHPALIELVASRRRLPYKMSKTTKYWPDLSLMERRASLLAVWHDIAVQLDRRVDGVLGLLPLPGPDSSRDQLKGYEDALDAVVCAWVATCVIDGSAVALGDADSAIWVPSIQALK